EDLFYRLNVIAVEMPSLRDRDDDVVLLARHFLHCFSEDEEKQFSGFTQDAENMLKRYSWPGNVRQLQNLIHSCVVMNDGPMITADMLNDLLTSREQISTPAVSVPHISTDPNVPSISSFDSNLPHTKPEIEPLALMERKAIQQAIALYDDNVVKAASALEVSPSTLYRKMQQWEE
ncbi:helix-turn-helix domain-containing protein, partial [Alteromonas sp. AMM-1]|uniref:helix-turn-helix domain-containing protein n=1 Tax=Alteromonas sp. AMM-1 TaxID=3394233 RepID=UPI0039A48177